jgi:hypothetical protein
LLVGAIAFRESFQLLTKGIAYPLRKAIPSRVLFLYDIVQAGYFMKPIVTAFGDHQLSATIPLDSSWFFSLKTELSKPDGSHRDWRLLYFMFEQIKTTGATQQTQWNWMNPLNAQRDITLVYSGNISHRDVLAEKDSLFDLTDSYKKVITRNTTMESINLQIIMKLPYWKRPSGNKAGNYVCGLFVVNKLTIEKVVISPLVGKWGGFSLHISNPIQSNTRNCR